MNQELKSEYHALECRILEIKTLAQELDDEK